ncbi:MAG: DinB family protein [Acidimicrobiales bacterium]
MTSTEVERCEVCGFVWDDVALDAVPARLTAAIVQAVSVLHDADPDGAVRPRADRWSVNEYAGHLRDVMLTIRDRILSASIVDTPTGTPIYRDERVNLGFYARDTTGELCSELTVIANLFVKTVESLPPGFGARPLLYSPITPITTTIAWCCAQAVHECEHHLADMIENLTK